MQNGAIRKFHHSGPRGREFESRHSDHVGASFVSLAPIFLEKSERTHTAVPPFPQKATFAFPARLVCPLGAGILVRALAHRRPFAGYTGLNPSAKTAENLFRRPLPAVRNMELIRPPGVFFVRNFAPASKIAVLLHCLIEKPHENYKILMRLFAVQNHRPGRRLKRRPLPVVKEKPPLLS